MSKARATLPVATETRKPSKSHELAVMFLEAQACHLQGQLAEAQALYQKILRKHPNHFDTLHMLGVCEYQAGELETAARRIKRALLVNAQSAAAHSNLSTVLLALKRADEALLSAERALALQPDFADAHFNRGNALHKLWRFRDAIVAYDAALALNPHYVDAHNNRGSALHELARFREAIPNYDRALALNPQHLMALTNRGASYKDLGLLSEAAADFDRALAIDSNHADAWSKRGDVLLSLGYFEDAFAYHKRALAIDEKIVDAWLGLAIIYMFKQGPGLAMECCERAIALDPQSVKAITQLGRSHAMRGEIDQALACFDRALALKPYDETALSNKIFNLDLSAEADFARHYEVRSEWWKQLGSRILAAETPRHHGDRDPSRRIVLGYVSGDFRATSPAYTFRPVLQNHDKSCFEVVCYSTSPLEDAVTDAFKAVADKWRDVVEWSDDRLVECIRDDRIDILIDLSGHTAGNRLHVFARKAAPVQVTAWGFGSGSGLPTIDYLFADPVSVPAEARQYFAEKIYDLPTLLIVEPPPAGLRRAEPPVVANGYVSYGVFNRVSKISDAAIAVWARILHRDASAGMVIKDTLLDDQSVQRTLWDKFAGHGIDPGRIEMLGPTHRDEHLAAFGKVDICLDPFPQVGGVSTWEALYMGVPVVTKLGPRVSSRVAGGILAAVGLADWVGSSEEDYIEIALRSDPERLRAIRQELPDRIAARCGPAAYTAEVEKGYRMMWQEYCAASDAKPTA